MCSFGNFFFFQIITFLESKFEEAGRTAISPQKNFQKSSKDTLKWAHKLRKSRPGAGTPSDRAMGYPPGSGEKSIKVYSCGVLGRPEGVLGASWGHLGGVLGRLEVVLGRLGGVLEASWGVWGASWGRFECFLGRLKSVWEASWSVLVAMPS